MFFRKTKEGASHPDRNAQFEHINARAAAFLNSGQPVISVDAKKKEQVFVHRHGPLSARDNIRAFVGDPDFPLLLSLENYNQETKRVTKTAIFERRTLERYKPVEHVETP